MAEARHLAARRRALRAARRRALRRLNLARIHRPYTLVFALVLQIPGALAIVFGDHVSAALAAVQAGLLTRMVGVLLLAGSLVTLFGIARGRSYVESVGLIVMATGCTIYGVGAILGLGLAGAFAGCGFLGIAAGAVLRVTSLTGAARQLDELDYT